MNNADVNHHDCRSLIKTFPCVAAFMSSLTIVCVALDRFRCIVQSHRTQVDDNFGKLYRSLSSFHLINANGFASILFHLLGTRQKEKKKCGKFHTWGGGSGPGHFPHFFYQKKNNNKVVFKLNFKPFSAILSHFRP